MHTGPLTQSMPSVSYYRQTRNWIASTAPDASEELESNRKKITHDISLYFNSYWAAFLDVAERRDADDRWGWMSGSDSDCEGNKTSSTTTDRTYSEQFAHVKSKSKSKCVLCCFTLPSSTSSSPVTPMIQHGNFSHNMRAVYRAWSVCVCERVCPCFECVRLLCGCRCSAAGVGWSLHGGVYDEVLDRSCGLNAHTHTKLHFAGTRDQVKMGLSSFSRCPWWWRSSRW